MFTGRLRQIVLLRCPQTPAIGILVAHWNSLGCWQAVHHRLMGRNHPKAKGGRNKALPNINQYLQNMLDSLPRI